MIRGLWACGVLVLATTVAGLCATVVSLLRPGSHFAMRAAKLWSRAMLGATGGRLEFHGVEAATANLPCIYVSNHQSNADIWALIVALPLSTRFIAKKSLFHVPILGWALRAAGFISIDRRNRVQAIASLERAAERVREGISLVVFPEGTRSTTGRLGEFKKGPFHLALEAGVPLIPVAISGSFEHLPPGSLHVRPGTIRVRFFPAIDVERFGSDNLGLAAEVHAIIASGLAPPETEPSSAALEPETP